MASIWQIDETKTYDVGKQSTTFTKWRVLIMERLAVIADIEESEAATIIARYSLLELGLDYDRNVTAEQVAQKLAK